MKTASERMVAVRLRSCSGIVLVISIYMPTVYGNSEALEDYNMELRYLDWILDSEVFDAVVVLGDFNADLCKSGRFSKLLMSFLNDFNRYSCRFV